MNPVYVWSKNGNDYPECGEKPIAACKTIKYVFDEIIIQLKITL
jgi:hypothetical protein